MWAIILGLIPILMKLWEILKARKELTPREQARLNKVIGLMNKIQTKAVAMGCAPYGDATPFTAAEMSEEEDD